MKAKKFSTAVIISVYTGRLLVEDFSKVYELLNFMTGDNLMTHQLIRVSKEVMPYLLDKFPWLADAEIECKKVNRENWKGYVNLFNARYDAEHSVKPIPADDHDIIDPIVEFKRDYPDKEIIAFDLGQDDPPEPSPYGDIDWKV